MFRCTATSGPHRLNAKEARRAGAEAVTYTEDATGPTKDQAREAVLRKIAGRAATYTHIPFEHGWSLRFDPLT